VVFKSDRMTHATRPSAATTVFFDVTNVVSDASADPQLIRNSRVVRQLILSCRIFAELQKPGVHRPVMEWGKEVQRCGESPCWFGV
jgi:hypothetical protein